MARTFVIDLDRCSGCTTCIVACKFENDPTLGNYRTDVVEVGPYGTHPDIEMYWVPFRCQQCSDAPCVEVCPTGASYRHENGTVLINQEACIGCKSCLSACPFSDPDGHTRPSVRWMDTATNTISKCTLCNHLTKNSDGVENPKNTYDPDHAVPPCVHNCPNKALHYGDLDDPASDASVTLAAAEAAGRAVHSLESAEAKPTTKYILSETAEWQGLGEGFVLRALS